jgi:hypothetical protein
MGHGVEGTGSDDAYTNFFHKATAAIVPDVSIACPESWNRWTGPARERVVR